MDYGVSPQQLAVICALSSGATLTFAAEQAGVHRNTINNWRRNSPPFQQAFAHAQYDRALCYRERIEDLVDLAIQALHDILNDPDTPPSVRLKAALAIVAAASTPPEPKKQVELDLEKIVFKKSRTQTITEDQLEPAPPVTVHNPAQAHKPAQPGTAPAPATPPEPPQPQPVHNSAQRRTRDEIARNAQCPCGSGKKYKRCCIDVPIAPSARKAA